ncbi:PLP-dependent aminotransferase family protein [Actinomadura rayongensis]|nr:PLP-dependent aminotransferase family protein [Actinomadura rayongensis]
MDLHLPLDRTSGLAVQIAAGLRAGIRAGRLTAGTRLPSSRALAQDLGVSRGVVVTAYEQLLAEGFLVARPGDGTRVAPLARPSAGDAGAARPDEPRAAVADLRPGQPDLAAFPRARWLAALRAALRDSPHDALLGYPDPAGDRALRTELAGYLGRVRAADASADRITIVSGVAHGLSALAGLLARDGRVLAVEDPTSDRQLPLLHATGARIVRVPVDAEGLDVAALAASSARAVLVTPAHQYPTGVVLSPARRAALIAWARATGGIVVEDDYDAEFRYDRDPVGCLQGVAPERVVLLGSVTKALAPALRLGWAVAPPALTDGLREHRALTDLGNPSLEQRALARFLADGGHDRHLRVMRRRYRARRDALAAALRARLPDATVRGVSAGLHLYVELPPGCDEDAVVAAAADGGVLVTGARSSWSRERADAAPPALVLGYGRTGTARLERSVEVLARAVTPRAHG